MPTVLRRDSEPNSPIQKSAAATISTHSSGTAVTMLERISFMNSPLSYHVQYCCYSIDPCRVAGPAADLACRCRHRRRAIGNRLAAQRGLFGQRQNTATAAALLVGDHDCSD